MVHMQCKTEEKRAIPLILSRWDYIETVIGENSTNLNGTLIDSGNNPLLTVGDIKVENT